jgi:hypothetical protein
VVKFWLNPLLDDSQCGYITNLEKKKGDFIFFALLGELYETFHLLGTS